MFSLYIPIYFQFEKNKNKYFYYNILKKLAHAFTFLFIQNQLFNDKYYNYKEDIELLERVQQRATKLVPELKDLSDENLRRD